MPETMVYAPGTPMWVDISAKDVEKCKNFYSSLFGWDTWVSPDPEAGGYGMFKQDGKVVAGFGPIQDPNGHTAWLQYICSEDAKATADRIAANGGTVIVPPMQVMNQGWFCVFTDPSGAWCGIWQPIEMHGAELKNEPVSFAWSELNSRDLHAAQKFFPAVFDWGISEQDFSSSEGPGKYTMWKVDGKDVAGAMDMPSQVPVQVPSHWMIYWAVEDCDATAAKVGELGGQVTLPPMDIAQGRMAVCVDDQGAAFAIIKMAG